MDAIVLLSGGIDSATALAMSRAVGLRCHALSFRYGQRHAVELEAATRVARALGAAGHDVINLDLRAIGGSALTDDIEVPKGRDEAQIGSGIPITYVPARNTIFLSYAIALAEVRGATDIVLGVNVLDSSGYPD
jgi:7-cyano-7-deazaguanine synthase